MVDEATRNTLSAIPLMKTKAGPREKEAWVQRLKEEYKALIMYVENNKKSDTDWFRYAQGEPSGWLKHPVDLILTVMAAGGLLQ